MPNIADSGIVAEERSPSRELITKEKLLEFGILGWKIESCKVDRMVQSTDRLLVTVSLSKILTVDDVEFKAIRTVSYATDAEELVFETPELATVLIDQIK